MEDIKTQRSTTTTIRSHAFRFIVLVGIVSLFADMTYEGARGIIGPYLAVLGASGAVVGFVAGFGELLGYAFRLVSGYISDRTRQYWLTTILGYVINLGAVPLLALTGNWQLAAILVIAERMGKALRVPARDAMLSHAASQIGTGKGFGIHEALDQIGAVVGPLIVAATLFFTSGSYRTGFAVLAIPAILSIATLIAARVMYPAPHKLEIRQIELETQGLRGVFWVYMLAIGLIAAGYADFPLIAYHFQKANLFSQDAIPILYTVAMGTDALAALFLGALFDRMGMLSLAIGTVLSALFAPLSFLGNAYLSVIGVIMWGIGMGAQESIMRAAVSRMVPADRRGAAFGVFNTGYGLFWFGGSLLMGVLYDISIPLLVLFSVLVQVASVVIILSLRGRLRLA
ncbi:major facilitator superfamily MFS_1 [Thermobaculum terrenum ATCC BAA-798]|uniref:Major facilitator superfamily MFS_1 n=1 Tax=Thermobaculum terrenum (strain ATCC BAA-798 / CCMEE 7001 / YNP1) TaxID=525904 RepID=D1CCE5_THET1|nr:MFS transporter [Thermobaculum terrenum]ACZ42460.1 major facilitator superfamily MFS_1 [Thermobaculum terrenum ATCC BAA-798]